MTKRAVGTGGEDIAEAFLRKRGLKVIGRNIIRHGVEADILAKDGRVWVVIEVKTKFGTDFGLPQEMVGYHKQRQLKRFAQSLISEHGDIPIRIDVVAVTLGQAEPRIEYLQNVVEELQ